MRIRVALLVASLLLMAVVGAVIADALNESWRGHQRAYGQLANQKAAASAQAAIAAGGLEIKQDIVSGFGKEVRVDRCRTCHAAIDDAAFADGTEPLRTHPPMPEHSFTEFGCTICHDGNGRGLTAALAHGDDPYWPEPLLRGPYIEAACARCHAEPYVDAMPHVRRGRDLFTRYACVGCHTVRGMSRGKLGPDLSDVGKRLKADYLDEFLSDPKAKFPTGAMPNFGMPKEDRVALVTFLKSLEGRSVADAPISVRIKVRRWKEERPAEVPVTLAAGKQAVERRGCGACHRLSGADGRLAPDLTRLGLMRDADYVAVHLADPRAQTPGSIMPNFWLSASERQAIALYLASLTEVEVPAAPAAQYEALCARCHGKEGRGDGVVAGSLLPQPRAFTNAKYFNWLPEERARRAILRGVPGTAMPPFGRILSEEQAGALFRWVRANFSQGEQLPVMPAREVPEVNPAGYSEDSAERGARVFERRCYGCHGRRADGKGPNAIGLVPQPRDLTSKPFFSEIPDRRIYESLTYGVVGTAMPPWDILSDETRWDLVNFVRRASGTAPSTPTDSKEGGSNG